MPGSAKSRIVIAACFLGVGAMTALLVLDTRRVGERVDGLEAELAALRRAQTSRAALVAPGPLPEPIDSPSAVVRETAPAELAALETRIRLLDDGMKKLSNTFDDLAPRPDGTEAADSPTVARGEDDLHGPDLGTLAGIRLRANPGKADLREYVRQILAASRDQRSSGSGDPQVAMLAKVGSDNLDVLLDTSDEGHFGNSYLHEAIAAIAREEHKTMILDRLALNKDLVEVVRKKAWIEDAREILLGELRAHPPELPPEWIQAVVSLGDPSSTEDLKQFLIHGSNRGHTYAAIKDIPGIDLADTVRDAWASARGNDWEVCCLAPTAMEYGQADALELTVRSLGSGVSPHRFVQGARDALLRCTEAQGGNDEIVRWYDQNKDRLVFDPGRKKFVVPR